MESANFTLSVFSETSEQPPGPQTLLTEAADGDSQFWNTGSQVGTTGPYHPPPGERTRDGSEKELHSLS